MIINIMSDVILFTPEWKNKLFLTRTYKNIRSYLGLVKRDLKLFDKHSKKQFHVAKGLYISEKLINNELPNVDDLSKLNLTFPRNYFENKLDFLRNLLNTSEISLYPNFIEDEEFVKILTESNNIKEFSYN